ncbi:uncharacterized protein CC84DRAFT_1192601 [Paraphaeosphaeria sporulosa]|uniref:Zn(2)-C6 fungal-type domain-containing protein n=1 Tax=Paraphaeosphaeria sporulosa TaxID=1460663 RepID=A0A177CZL6_9PLEO|nr:uncharacterized protein CC84DRAFT_1192601 [Paraphaeosphaeria sporulosa]OAG12407.1 hypothetical protein CC84DRAFT_1192601 [Paraphaeosphaeria sporulosa]
MKKRSRACEECHRLKIKCDLSTSPAGTACERCSRNNLECVPSTPRLQRDRISELEAQVEELKRTLREQSNSSTPSQSPASQLEDHNAYILSFLDVRIPLGRQQDLLHLFPQQAGAVWPVIRVITDLNYIRERSPILLLSILVYTVTHNVQGTQLEVHDELVRHTVHILGEEVIGRGQRSLELVQALLVAAFWNKSTRKGEQGSCYQLIQLATDMAIDIARRTWLACFVALASSASSLRRPITVPWNAHHEECVSALESIGEPSDIFLCQLVRIQQLIQDIHDQLFLSQIAAFVDSSEFATYAAMSTLKNRVDAWAAQIPPGLASSQTLKVWYHVAMIFVFEPVLHTPTNKAAFVAPFIPGRIPINDFPKPTNITIPLKLALEGLVSNCHGVIDTVTEMDPSVLVNISTFSFTPLVLYSLYVLVTVMVSANDPANTYGQYVARESFRIEACGLKLRHLSASMKALDPTFSCYTTRMMDATNWLEQWYNDYTAILRRYEANLAS